MHSCLSPTSPPIVTAYMKSSIHYTEFNSYTRIAALSSYNLTTNTFKKEIGEENLILSF